MPTIPRIDALHAEMTAWRRDLHAHPETAFEEARTSDFVAEKLSSFGVEVHRGLAKTGVVGTLRAGSGRRAIGLRADMDALHVHEANTFAHRSRNEGRMHACGHDGHTTMLLGAARHLAETRAFDGTVHFIFQPAEENEGGGRVMVEDGLFEKFPVEAVFGMHNWPGIPAGQLAVMPGIMMASFDIFEIKITGRGAHAGMPHHGVDAIVAGSALVQALQAIVSRGVSPVDAAVVSVTQFHAGDTWNVLPDKVTLRGSARALKPEVQALVEGAMRRVCDGIAAAHGCQVTMRYERRYPPIINTPKEVAMAIAAMTQVIGADKVLTDIQPTMGAEDFAFMLRERPGAYVWLGNGVAGESRMLHNPGYDFNDEILPIGASYWVTLVEQTLSKGALDSP
ncbi:M20 aminoacylase family protein [Sorangium sp. So ce145]|uniref:M20 aminoacylase family protein n=1 Tax=Sorangium sp. So ce145 TaxID=3133285 RepID=UPI003F646DF5